jgi:hypothetical protein
VLLLANHGCILVGRTLAQAMEDLYYLERAAMNQLLAQVRATESIYYIRYGWPVPTPTSCPCHNRLALAQGGGAPLQVVEPEVCRRFQEVCQESTGKADYADIFFEAWMKKLDRSEPEYAELSPPAEPILWRRGPPSGAKL